ncbi:MAG: hypothetical protein PVG78_15210, partial [Desulfobacterales bacterium]
AVNGLKVSGNAQFTNLRRMLTHGTLLFCADLDALQRALVSSAAIVDSRGMASVPSPVANLDSFFPQPPDMAGFKGQLLSALENRLGTFEALQLSEAQARRIDRLHRWYRSWQWTWGRSPRFSVDHQLSAGAEGPMRLRLTVEGGIVREALRLDGLQRATPDAKILLRPYDEVIGFSQSGKVLRHGFSPS